LAAIVSADVAGYSRLMGRAESRTLAPLKAHRHELIDPKIAEYGGRIVKTTGDGLLLEFASVVDAVRSAVEVQRGMAERNRSVPIDLVMEFGSESTWATSSSMMMTSFRTGLMSRASPGARRTGWDLREQGGPRSRLGQIELGTQEVKPSARTRKHRQRPLDHLV
jgi:hypothetical protein